MKKCIHVFISCSIFLATSCMKGTQFPGTFPVGKDGKGNNGNQLKIAIVSDIHYMAASLLKNNAAAGAAFQAYLIRIPN